MAQFATDFRVPSALSLQILYRIWHNHRSITGGLPAPSQFNPNTLSPMLNDLFLGERVGLGMVRLVITGDHFASQFGHGLDGFPLSLLFAPAARGTLYTLVSDIFDQHSAQELVLHFDQGPDLPAVTGRMLLLPLQRQSDGNELLVGALALFGTLRRRMPRCTILAQETPSSQMHKGPMRAGPKPHQPLPNHLRLVHSGQPAGLPLSHSM